jgi:hypothetical protein
MYLVLLVFGVVLAVAGAVLAALGLPVMGHPFDPAIATPGAVAFVGGVVLFALGLALRVLKRIERAIAAHSTPSREPVLPEIAVDTAAASKAFPRPLPSVGRRGSIPEKRLDDALDKMAEKTPDRLGAAARLETARVGTDADLSAALAQSLGLDSSLPAPSSVVVEKEVVEVGGLRARRVGGVARTAPRLDLATRAPLRGERSKEPGFDLWPKGPRPSRLNQQPPASPALEPVELKTESEPAETPSPALAAEAPSEPVTILKSGVVDGMAYTLFSDGSIEAELPQGRLRFGSITELRNHIEQSA